MIDREGLDWRQSLSGGNLRNDYYYVGGPYRSPVVKHEKHDKEIYFIFRKI